LLLFSFVTSLLFLPILLLLLPILLLPILLLPILLLLIAATNTLWSVNCGVQGNCILTAQ
jgi:hypothetical protein